jgi:hypothetical protein
VIGSQLRPDAGTPFTIVWGSGDEEKGRETFPTLGAVRGFLEYETDMTPAMIEKLILTGQSSDADEDPTGPTCTQFDCAWVRLERKTE